MNSFFLYNNIKGFSEVKDTFSGVKKCENDSSEATTSVKNDSNNRNASNANVGELQICQSDEILSFVTNRERDNYERSTTIDDDEHSFLRRILREDSIEENGRIRNFDFDIENSSSGSIN